MNRTAHLFVTAAALLTLTARADAQEHKRITILYDAFGKPSGLVRDWGFAAFVEYGGRRILFDTGNNAKIFEHNVKQLGIDVKRLDAVVISHRHGDHTSGLTYVLEANPDVKIYSPDEIAFFKWVVPQAFLKPYSNLPADLRYYGGKPPERILTGTPWGEKGKFNIVKDTTEIFPGFFILTTRSQKPGTMEMNEASLAIRTPEGLAIVVGCSHPGVDKILEEAVKIDPKVYTVAGGFHLVLTPREEVERVANVLHDSFRIKHVAPGHCTSELGMAVFRDRFKEHFDPAGLGAVLSLP